MLSFILQSDPEVKRVWKPVWSDFIFKRREGKLWRVTKVLAITLGHSLCTYRAKPIHEFIHHQK